jgi:hypothetical protein
MRAERLAMPILMEETGGSRGSTARLTPEAASISVGTTVSGCVRCCASADPIVNYATLGLASGLVNIYYQAVS